MRAAIDKSLLKKYDLSVQPVIKKGSTSIVPSEFTKYIVVFQKKQEASGPINLIAQNILTENKIQIHFPQPEDTGDDKQALADLKRLRSMSWYLYGKHGGNTVLNTWYKVDSGKKGSSLTSSMSGRQQRGLTAFSILGGRAAVQETLQMQSLDMAPTSPEERTIPIEQITGVGVKSHPFSEMLGKSDGGTLKLANVTPYDHFFVYAATPQAILSFLENGAGFISRFGNNLTGNDINYNLKSKYLGRLGLDEKWLKLFVKSGAVADSAFIFPDLFLIDSTELTVVSRLRQPGLINSLLKLAGVSGLINDNVLQKELADGSLAFWAMRDDLLFVSTSKMEIDTALQIHKEKGGNSLGRSAEFRYMLTKLPVLEKTSYYAYFSDPFIRHLVGPATKITQLRRIMARSKMENITAAALLYKLDGNKKPVSVKTLWSQDYIADHDMSEDFYIDDNMQVHSRTYGTLEKFRSNVEIPVEMATEQEEKLYKQYLENYNRFWRQYFDPIAIRINDLPDSTKEAEIFILPLIDNTFYNGLRDVLVHNEDEISLKVPELTAPPLVMLSLNLQENAWVSILKTGFSLMSRYAFIRPEALDDFGPGLHLAIMDSDPIIAFGSGDLLGAFNADLLRMGGGGGALMIPVALSILTRPCTLFIETQSPERTKQFLQLASRSSTARLREREITTTDLYQLEGKDEWIYTVKAFGVITMRFGLEVQGNYLLIRNIPWSNKETIARVETFDINGALLSASLASANQQLEGLFFSSEERLRAGTFKGSSYLYPLVVSGYTGIEDAANKHYTLFGFLPVHPYNGKWYWQDQHIFSSQYGSVFRQKQPDYSSKDKRFGLFGDIDNLSLSMQFEDAGLRSIIRWHNKNNN